MDVQNILNSYVNYEECEPIPSQSKQTQSTTLEFEESQQDGDGSGSRRLRGKAWSAWEDRALVRQVIADDPIMNKVGRKEDRWREVSHHLKSLVGMDRSWSSCKDRVDKLVSWHRQDDTRSKQKSGAVEEIDEHLKNMCEIVLLFDSVSLNSQIKTNARDKLAERKKKGIAVREASLLGQVRKRDLLAMEDNSESRDNQGPIRKTPKNSFSKEVQTVVGDLYKKAEEFKIAIVAKEERERKNSEEQKKLNEKLDALIDSTKATNETMRNLMNVFIQGALRPPTGN